MQIRWLPEVVRRLFTRGTLLAELDEELAMHRALLIEQNRRRGLNDADAERAAVLALGSATSIREQYYEHAGWALLDTCLQDLRYAWRGLRRSSAFTLGAVATLGLAIGVNTAVFSFADALLWRSLPYQNPDELVVLDRLPTVDFITKRAEFHEWREKSTLLAGAAVYVESEVNITGGQEPLHVRLAQVTANLPLLFGAQPVVGRNFAADEDIPNGPPVAMISARLWERQFAGREDILARPLTINGQKFTIVGVLPPRFDYPPGTDIWTPTVHSERLLDQWGAMSRLYLPARMQPGVTRAQVAAQQKSAFGQRYSELLKDQDTYFSGLGFTRGPIVTPLQQLLAGDLHKPAKMLLGAVALILLIACANLANLVLARALTRQREFAVRLALGVSASRLVRQVITEQLCLSGLGGTAGIALAYASIPILQALLPGDWPAYAEVQLNGRVLLFSIAAAGVAALLTALAPALHLLRRRRDGQPISVHGDRWSEDRAHQRGRGMLIAGEACLTMLLLAASGVLISSLIHLVGVNPGFQPQGVLTVTLTRPKLSGPAAGTATRSFYASVAQRLRSLPGVRAVSGANSLPARTNTASIVHAKALHADKGETVSPRVILPGYFAAMGVPLIAGSDFKPADHEGSPKVVIVSDTLARKFWPAGQAIGQQLSVPPDKPVTVAGVVGSTRFWGPTVNPLPEIYYPLAQSASNVFSFVLRTDGDPSSYAAAVRSAIRDVDPQQPIDDITPLSEYWRRSWTQAESLATFLSLFTLLGISLALVGVCSVTAYSVARRQREFGIRLVLGASPGQLIADSVRRALSWVAAGVAAGVLLAFLMRQLLAGVIYGVAPWQPGLSVALALTFCALAIVACWTAARRVAVLDAARSLRCE